MSYQPVVYFWLEKLKKLRKNAKIFVRFESILTKNSVTEKYFAKRMLILFVFSVRTVRQLTNDRQFAFFGADPREEIMVLERGILQ